MTFYFLSLIWQLLLLGIFLGLSRKTRSDWTPSHPVYLLLVTALFVRLVPAFCLAPGSNYDIESFSLVGQHVLQREDVYTGIDTANRHPYLPLQMVWMGMARWLANKSGLPFPALVRLAPIIADTAISLWLFVALRKRKGGANPTIAALLYAVNPVAIYVSAFHGQFDALPILCILLGLSQAGLDPLKSGGWLGLGIWFKSWPILVFPSFWNAFRNQKQRILLVAPIILLPLFGIGLYSYFIGADPRWVFQNALSYNHGIGVWGYTYLLRLAGIIFAPLQPVFQEIFPISRYITLLILVIVWFRKARFEYPAEGSLTILAGFFAFTHAFAIQYLVWILPFAILCGEFRWQKLFTIASFSYMFLAYNTLILNNTITNLLPWPLADLAIIIPAGLPAWLISVGWLWQRLREPVKSQLTT